DQGVGHPRCLGTRPKHLSTRGKRRARTPPSCCIPYIGDERLPVGPRLGITSVSYPDTAPKMFLVYLHWYAHCASAAELETPEPQAVEIQVDDRRRVQRQQLAKNQATDNGDAQRPAQLRASTGAEH